MGGYKGFAEKLIGTTGTGTFLSLKSSLSDS